MSRVALAALCLLALLAALVTAAPAQAKSTPLTTKTAKRAVTAAIDDWRPLAFSRSVTCKRSGRGAMRCAYRVRALTKGEGGIVTYTGTATVVRRNGRLRVTLGTKKVVGRTQQPKTTSEPAPVDDTSYVWPELKFPPSKAAEPAPTPPRKLESYLDAQVLVDQVVRSRVTWLEHPSAYPCTPRSWDAPVNMVGTPLRCRFDGKVPSKDPLSYRQSGGYVTVTLRGGDTPPDITLEADPTFGTVEGVIGKLEAEAFAAHPQDSPLVMCGERVDADARGRTLTCTAESWVLVGSSHWEEWTRTTTVTVSADGWDATFDAQPEVHTTGPLVGGGGGGSGGGYGGTWYPGFYVPSTYVPGGYVSGYGYVPGFTLPGYNVPGYYG